MPHRLPPFPGSPIFTPCSNPACSWGTWLFFSCSLMSLSVVLQPVAKGGIKPQSAGTSNPCPRGSGRSKSSLGHCGQHLIPAEWFSTLRPARERNRQLNLPTACSTSWLQPAGDSFPQGGCQQLSWGTLRLSVPAVWSEVLGDSENLCKWSLHWAGCGESRKVLHVGPGHSLVPLPSLSLLERLHSHEFTDPVM